MLPLQDTLYDTLYKKYIVNLNNNINIQELAIFLKYSILNHNYLVIYVINDILNKLNTLNKINYFFEFYNYCISQKMVNTFLLQNYILSSINCSYFKNPLFGKHFLVDFNTKVDFKEHFLDYTDNLFEDFNWSNCIIAGGAAFKIIQKDFKQRKQHYKYSDIDIFVYGQTKTKKKKIIYILQYLIERLNEFYVVNFNNVLSIISPNYHREIQIIVGSYKTPLQVICDFDLSHLQLLYNGSKIQTISSCIHSINNNYSKIMKYKINKNLLYKIYSINYKIKINNSLNEDFSDIMKDYNCKEDFLDIYKTELKKKYQHLLNVQNNSDNIINDILEFKDIKNCYSSRVLFFNNKSIKKNLTQIVFDFNGNFENSSFYLCKII